MPGFLSSPCRIYSRFFKSANYSSSISDDNTQIISVLPDIPFEKIIRSKNSHILVHKLSKNSIIRIVRYVLLNFNISLKICLTKNNYDSIVFYYGQGLLLPVLTGKLWRKKIYWLLPSSFSEMTRYNPDPFTKLLFYYHQFSLDTVDHIILFSPRLISQWNLEKFRYKILICPFHNTDVDTFRIITPYPDRPPPLAISVA